MDLHRPPPDSFDPFHGPPRINGARKVGIRPGTELIHPIAATGTRPLQITVEGLPAGLVLTDGVLRGTAPSEPGNHQIHVRVENTKGSAGAFLVLCVGPTLALTPPMGWNSWNVFGNRVSADVVVRVAERFVDTGLRDLGYQYINIDDHWHATRRAADGTPRADPAKFPDGIGPVADQLHAMGLKLGIYSDAAELTCGGCFGGLGFEELDARTYAEWGVDLLKYDYCHAPLSATAAKARYRTMGSALEGSGRSIVFNICEWGYRRPWRWERQVGAAYWRTTGDIFDSFTAPVIGVRSIARRNMRLADHASPGHWNDPDMLLVGNRGAGRVTSLLQPPQHWRWHPVLWRFGGLDDAEARTHMSLWAMMAAPLLASHDVETISDADLDLLRNPDILAINQDTLGHQARPQPSPRGTWVLVKRLEDGRRAVSITNHTRQPRTVTVSLSDLQIAGPAVVHDVWANQAGGESDVLRAELPAHATQLFLCTPASNGASG